MKLRYFLPFWMFILFGTDALAQTNQVWLPGSTPTNTVVARNNLFALGSLAPGTQDTTGGVSMLVPGAMRLRPQDSLIYVFNGRITGKKWNVIGTVGTVTSVNGQTGTVTLSIPTNTNQLVNGNGFITSAGAPVQSVNGLVGAVTIDGSIVHLGGDSHLGVSGAGTGLSPYLISFNRTNFDTLNGRKVDTGSIAHQGYVVSYDSVNKKYVLVPQSGGAGAGVTSFNTRSGTVVLISADVVAALGFTPLNPANNLNDLSSASAGRTNLGLGTSATHDVPASGNASSTQVVLGNDTRLINNQDSGVVIVNTVQQAGPIFSDNFARSSLGSNYTATGGTYSFPSSLYLQMTGGDGTFNNYIIRNQTVSTHQHTDTLMFVPTVVNGTSFGASIGVQSWQPGTKRDLLAQFSVSNATLVGNITIYGQPDYPTAILAQSSSLTFSVGDTLLGTSVRNDNTINAIFRDLSTGASVTCTYTYPTSNVSGYLLHNTGNPILYNNGGTNKILLWKVVNNQSKTNDVIVGNSLVSYDASSSITSWPNILYNARSDYSVVCGPGDRTANAITQLGELNSYAPKKIFIDIGINDLLGGVSAATFSTQYDSLCHYSKNLNVPVYLLSLSPTTTSVVAFNDTIQLKAIKYGFTYIDVYSWLKVPTGTTLSPLYDGGDGLHWNDAAHSLVAALLQPYRNRYSNNLSSGNVFTLTTNTTSGTSSYGGGILNIPQYIGSSSSLTSGRFAVSTASNSIADYVELMWDNTNKRVNFNGTLQVGDQTLTHAGYNTIGVGGTAKSGAIDFTDNGTFIGEFYTSSSNLNLFTNTALPINIYTNGATTTPNLYAFSQKVGINTGSPDSSLTIAGGLDIKSGLIMSALASGNASPSQTGARVALNIDANGRVGTYAPSLENTLANGANLSNSYTTTLGANSWTMNQNSTGRFKVNGMQSASGTYSVLTRGADSTFTQVSLATLAAAIGASGSFDTTRIYNELFKRVSHSAIVAAGDTIVFFGNSIWYGQNASDTEHRATTLIARGAGAHEINLGTPGSTLEKRIPIDPFGGTNFIDRLGTIPDKTPGMKLLIIEGGLNDVAADSTTYNATNFVIDYDSILRRITNHGWQSGNILLVGAPFSGAANYTGNNTIARHLAFIEATKQEALKWGTMFLDIRADQLKNDTTLVNSTDHVHPTDSGYAFIANDILQFLGIPNRANGLPGAIQLAGLNSRNTSNPHFGLNTSSSTLTYQFIQNPLSNGVSDYRFLDATGGEFGEFGYTNGGFANTGLFRPNQLFIDAQRLLFSSNTDSINFSLDLFTNVHFSINPNNIWTSKPISVVTNTNAGTDVSIVNTNGGSSVAPGFSAANGTYTYAAGMMGTGAASYGDRTANMAQQYTSSPQGIITMVDANGPYRIATNGNVTNFIFTGAGQFGVGTASPAASALADFSSTTRGLLMPRMTTTQRNAISSPATGLIVYNTTVDSFQYHPSSGGWQNLGAGSSGPDTLKVVPTPGNLGVLIGSTNNKDTIVLDRFVGPKSVQLTKNSDSSVTATLVNDTIPVASYTYGANAAGRLGFYQAPVSGTFVSTLTNTTNISAATLTQATYSRVGNVVHVTIGGTFIPTLTATNSVMTFSLPINTATTTQGSVGSGTIAYNGGNLGYFGAVVNIASASTGVLNFFPTVTAGSTATFSFSLDYTL